jgi:hypothetical protein
MTTRNNVPAIGMNLLSKSATQLEHEQCVADQYYILENTVDQLHKVDALITIKGEL